MTITSQIVTVNATVEANPAPSQLQQSGALVSVGGTTQSAGTYAYYATPGAVIAALSSSGNYQEIENMATTFFAQGNAVGLSILEFGVEGSSAAGITALGNWILANPGIFYAYLTPAAWDASGAALNTLASEYSSPTGQTYFFPTTTTSTISAYTTTNKAIFATVPSPTAASTESQSAAAFYNWVVNNPSASAPAPPLAYRFLYGVTPWPNLGNQASIDTVLTAYGNLVFTGAAGGISQACLFRGTTMDGNQGMAWWGRDWFIINATRNLVAAIINGSNTNPPLYYNQNGINQLVAVAEKQITTGVSYGLLLSGTVASVPFATYIQENLSNYEAGIYNGLSATIQSQLGFLTIVFNLAITQPSA